MRQCEPSLIFEFVRFVGVVGELAEDSRGLTLLVGEKQRTGLVVESLMSESRFVGLGCGELKVRESSFELLIIVSEGSKAEGGSRSS